MRNIFLIFLFGLSGCAVVNDKWYCENTFGAYEISYPALCLQQKNDFQKCLRNEKDKDIEYKKKTGMDRPIKLLNTKAPSYCKQYLKPQRLWKDTKLDDKGFPIKEEFSN